MPIDFSNPMAARAREILRANDTGATFQPSSGDHPHQWSWDAALVSIGTAQWNVERSLREMRNLMRGQWRNGMIPHIVFNPLASPGAYYPGPDVWASAETSPDAPRDVQTSGIFNPPVHAIAIRTMCDLTDPDHARSIAREFYRPLRDWHRYLMSARDPEHSGLVTIVHPSESGMMTSPRWDRALSRIEVPDDDRERYERPHRDPKDRPNDEDYTRYNRIIHILKNGGYRVESTYSDQPFRCKDVFISSMLVAANESLMRIATLADVDYDQLDIIEAWINRGRRGLAGQWDPALGMCCDLDLIDRTPIRIHTVASFAALLAGQVTPEIRARLVALWRSEHFVGHPDLRRPLPPTTSPLEPGFDPKRYWRGPVWPIMNWLMWWAWTRIGEFDLADELRTHALEQIREVGFHEYVEPFTGEGLGADAKSWTAAAALDWLAEQ